MPSPARPVQLPLPAEFEDLLRHLSTIYAQAYLERQSLSLQLSALGANSLGKESGGLSVGVHSRDCSPLKVDWTDRNLDLSLTANTVSELTLPVSDPLQPFEEVKEKEVSLFEAMVVDHKPPVPATSNLQPKNCCWNSKGKSHLEQYERLAARFVYGSNVLCKQHLLDLTGEYHPCMKKDFSKAALDVFISHSMEGGEGNEVLNSMGGLDGNEEILHLHAFNMLAGKQSFPSDQDMQDFVPALLQIRNALWLEEEDFQEQTRRDQEDWEMQIMDIIAAVLILLNAFVIGITVDMELTYTARESVDGAFTAFFLMELAFKMYVLGPIKFYTGIAWKWNVFDSLLVLIALVDTALMNTVFDPRETSQEEGPNHNIALVIRLCRLVRLMRLLRFEMFNDLRAMVTGVLAAMRILFWAMFMFLAFIVIIAMVIRVTFGEMETSPQETDYFKDRAFGTLMWSFFTLFRCFTEGCTAPDGTPLQVHLLERSGFLFMACYVLIFMFVTFGISNLIMALFIDHVMNAKLQKRKKDQERNAGELEAKLKEMVLQLAHRDRLFKTSSSRKGIFTILKNLFINWVQPKRLKEKSARKKSSYLKKKLQDENLSISRDAFNIWLKDEDVLDLLEEMDVDTAFKSGLFDCLDSDRSGELKVEELISGLMTLRGPPEKCDTVATLLCVRHQADMISDIHARLCKDNTTARFGFFK